MHDVLRRRLLRRIESLPEAQIYQVLDFVEFLESKYARDARVEPTVLQKFAEGVEDKLRNKAMNPATLREAFQLIAAADRVLADVTDAGKQILGELSGEPPPRRDLPRRRGSAAGSDIAAGRREESRGSGRSAGTADPREIARGPGPHLEGSRGEEGGGGGGAEGGGDGGSAS
jgi:hypothetical protein